MKKQSSFSVFLFMLVAVSGITSGCPGSVSVGGGCAYKDYEGIIIIKDITSQPGEIAAPGRADEKIYISYTFQAAAEAPSSVSNFPGEMLVTRADIEQKAVKIGGQFRGKAKYIERGSCNPGPYIENFENWQ